MKRNITMVFILLLISVTCGFAVTQPVRSRQLPVVGVVGKVHSASISPILGATTTSAEGMPFDILGAGVQYSSRPETGRIIATWSLLTNYYPATLSVTVTPLRGVVSLETLNYMLYIKYVYTCFDSSMTQLTVDDALIVETSNGQPGSASVVLSVPSGAISDSYIAINHSPVRFMFTDDISILEASPDDEYIATVTFTVTSD